MNCYKCDKCGVTVRSENINLVEIWNSYSPTIRHDLCPDCANLIRDLINEEVK